MMEMSFNKITIVVSDVVSTTSSVVSSVLPFNSRTPQASQPCHQCNVRVTEPGSKLCSQECAINYWEERCSSKGSNICKYPGCNKPCFFDASRQQSYHCCGQYHAKEYEKMLKSKAPSPNPNIADSRPIFFYNKDEAYYEFTNFADYPIVLDGARWNTSEHYFQAQKFVGTPYVAMICSMQQSREAFNFSRKPSVSSWKREDWEQIKMEVMLKALLAKFIQHKGLRMLLIKTGSRQLVEHTSNDNFWGDGGDGTGQNNLGKLLMKIRDILM